MLRREYNGLLTVVLAYVGLEGVSDLVVEGEPLNTWIGADWAWVLLFAISLPVCLSLRLLVRRTRVLHVAGR